MNRFSIFLLAFLWGCSGPSPKIVTLKEEPPKRKKERERINAKQRGIYQKLVQNSKKMQGDLENLNFVQKAEVSLWPNHAILDLLITKGKTHLSLPDKRQILRVVLKYNYTSENTKLIWRQSP